MELQNLRGRIKDLLSHMKDLGYTRLYMWSVDRMSRWLCEEASHHNWTSYADVEATMRVKWSNRHTLASKTGILRILRRFDEENSYPDGQRHYPRKSNYLSLTSSYKTIVDEACGIHPIPRTDSYRIWLTLSSFLLGLQKQGVRRLEDATQSDVLAIFKGSDGCVRGQRYCSSVANVIRKSAVIIGEDTASRLVSFLPCPPFVRKTVQFLTDDEVTAIKSVLDTDTETSLRDKAIIMIAIYTGLRSGDISSLRLDSIDWGNDLINIVQSKTGNRLTLPLRAIVGNAIFDYVVNERQESNEPFVFLSVNPPYRRLHSSNLNAICCKIMDRAGIRQSDGDRRGMHLFRHRVATGMLGNGIPQPVISATLGHSSPRSLDHYLDAELKRLQECSLSIARYPIGKEVFGI